MYYKLYSPNGGNFMFRWLFEKIKSFFAFSVYDAMVIVEKIKQNKATCEEILMLKQRFVNDRLFFISVAHSLHISVPELGKIVWGPKQAEL